MAKRKPGAQPGNNNAHKHGFYAKALGTAGAGVLRRARGLGPSSLLEEIALARARLYLLIGKEPTNHDILIRTLGTITRMVAVNHNLTGEEEREFGAAMQETLAELVAMEKAE